MDMLPDWEFPKTPPGFRLIGVKHPKPHHYMVGNDGKAYRVGKHAKYYCEHHPVFAKIKKKKED